jgi:hypothetical protein
VELWKGTSCGELVGRRAARVRRRGAGTLCLDFVGLTPRKNQYLNEVQGVSRPAHVAAQGAGSWTGHWQWGRHRCCISAFFLEQ